MRIGFDARWYNGSGVGTYVAALLDALGNLDGDFELIAYEHPENPVPVNSPKVKKIVVRHPQYSAAGQIEMARRSRADRLDVFHAPFYVVPLLARCPLVVTIHDLIPFLFRLYNGPHQALVQWGYQLAVNRAAHIIAVSQHTAKDISKIFGVNGEDMTVIHNACSPLFSPKSSSGERGFLRRKYGIQSPYVLTLSAGNWRTKNLHTALEALVRVRRSGVHFQTVIAGPKEGVQQCRADLKILAPVITGFVPHQDLPMLYRNADVFVTASEYEGFGLPLLEAMACGCAVVSSNAGSLQEVAGDGAVLVDCKCAFAMAESVSQLLMDHEARNHKRRCALGRAADFSWERTAQETLNAYVGAAASSKKG